MSANVERLTARIRLWLLKAYIRDLEAFRDGDEGRFWNCTRLATQADSVAWLAAAAFHLAVMPPGAVMLGS